MKEVLDHPTISRRDFTLKTKLKSASKSKGWVDLVIDNQGLVVVGQGHWTIHKPGRRKRCGWRKLHIG